MKEPLDTKSRILHEANSLFMRRGIRSVSMDDISRELGMSKKTLYQYFRNKADIVLEGTKVHFSKEMCMNDEIMNKAQDPVEELVMILQTFARMFREMPTNMIYETRKYYPQAWRLFHDFKNDYVLKALTRNLQTGVDLGLYRSEMDVDLVARLRVEQIEMVFDPDLFPPQQYDLPILQLEMFQMFLHGIVSIKGKKLIYKYLNQPEDD